MQLSISISGEDLTDQARNIAFETPNHIRTEADMRRVLGPFDARLVFEPLTERMRSMADGMTVRTVVLTCDGSALQVPIVFDRTFTGEDGAERTVGYLHVGNQWRPNWERVT